MGTLEEQLIERAHQIGFALAGIAPATPADGFDRLRDWLDQGHAGEMAYMHAHAEARRDPSAILPGVRSVIMVGMSYAPGPVGNALRGVPPANVGNALRGVPAAPERHGGRSLQEGRIARYAQGADYHALLRDRLKQLGRWLGEQRPGCWGRAVVDTAPLLERDFARRAGLGWFGKSTMLLNTRQGSWFVLGGLLVDIDLTPSQPFAANHCGTCTACLDACPTGAFVSPYVLDARRCISYLTIELKGDVPEDLRPEIDDWLFGCDVCQEVCPWNRKAPVGRPELAPREDLLAVDPIDILRLSEEQFNERFRGTALVPRPGRRVVARNAALVLGNTGDARALPALRGALHDSEAIVREAARWAIARIEQRLAGPAAGEVTPR
jgi:epoxyqueuosine reductase